MASSSQASSLLRRALLVARHAAGAGARAEASCLGLQQQQLASTSAACTSLGLQSSPAAAAARREFWASAAPRMSSGLAASLADEVAYEKENHARAEAVTAGAQQGSMESVPGRRRAAMRAAGPSCTRAA